MNKDILNKAVEVRVLDFHDILQTISDELNKGQRKKVLQNDKIKEAFDLFDVEY